MHARACVCVFAGVNVCVYDCVCAGVFVCEHENLKGQCEQY